MEKTKNRTERQKAQDFSLVKRDTSGIEEEIELLENSEVRDAISPTQRAKLTDLRAEPAVINEKKDEWVEEHPEHKNPVYRSCYKKAKEEASASERSIYYDPVMNPYGVAPPGMPYMERSLRPDEVDSQGESSEEEDPDDDIPLPSAPPPGSKQEEDEEEDSDDDIPMPASPPGSNALPPPPLPPGSPPPLKSPPNFIPTPSFPPPPPPPPPGFRPDQAAMSGGYPFIPSPPSGFHVPPLRRGSRLYLHRHQDSRLYLHLRQDSRFYLPGQDYLDNLPEDNP
ncbi:hypothetical protein M422DRAFT_783401 [Sphaerobolus stellatus SS14]|uniref:Wbp11/ELF5/Saf1 N-terminal domain-containing protein n=1 Tax=Sphaerobolus stellatus (strain SS14) TaxID=990650 RepID=A0A0C9V4Z5_SPHS4|nr:hypothetical protein M422DRAFT_783401 [Sphaerobolus stellatus SS14]